MNDASQRLLWLALVVLSGILCEPRRCAQADDPGTPPRWEEPKPGEVPQGSDPNFEDSNTISHTTSPQVITRNVLQDRNGDIWLATWSGLVRYDGTTFTNVTNQEGLSRRRVFSLMEDHQGNLWFGTIGAGVYRYDGETFTQFTEKDGLASDVVISMIEDRDHHLWFGGLGVTKYDGLNFTSFAESDGFTNSDVNSISQGTDGKLWFGTRGALFYFDGQTFVNFTEQRRIEIDRSSYIPTLIDRRGHLWFGGTSGIFHYDGTEVRHLFEPTSFSLMEDSRGNIWFSGGELHGQAPVQGSTVLNRFDPRAGLENLVSASKQIPVPSPAMIFGMAENRDGTIWFGSTSGVGQIDGDQIRMR